MTDPLARARHLVKGCNKGSLPPRVNAEFPAASRPRLQLVQNPPPSGQAVRGAGPVFSAHSGRSPERLPPPFTMSFLSRRHFLHLAAVGGVAATLPLPRQASAAVATAPDLPPTPNATRYRFRVGDFEAVALLVGGFMHSTPAQPFVAPQATAGEFASALAAASPTGRVHLHFHALLLRTGRENILIDAGPGGKQPAAHDLLTHLRALGLGPADISAVVLTHAHFDHLGGLLDEHDRVVFTRAEHFCLQEEYDFWTAAKPDFSHLRMDADSLLRPARRLFELVPFTKLRAGRGLPDGLTPHLSPGHTPGHMTLTITSRGESLYHLADLTHFARLMLPHPDWTIASDYDEPLAAATRRRVCTPLAAQRTRVFGSHVPFPALGALTARGDGFDWVPEDWTPTA